MGPYKPPHKSPLPHSTDVKSVIKPLYIQIKRESLFLSFYIFFYHFTIVNPLDPLHRQHNKNVEKPF